ncbi:hypothetical protein RN001_005505 [Aquatica leii]|uniref:Myb-like domain-containing protein n=1 Tax=Aquatica leii TaxID=1421715 RepID=A0AAN7PJY9_9COLE|nr:hypothetical protein RN001_005505 [Aquatica leii]
MIIKRIMIICVLVCHYIIWQMIIYNFLVVVGPIKSIISDEVAQPSPQPREDLNESEEKKIWTDANVGLLIKLYKKYENEFKSGIKKTIWNKVAESLCEVVGVSITWVQCDTKWKGLVRQYKVIKKHNETSGNENKYWKFYCVINDIMHKKPEIQPVAVCSSSRGFTPSSTPSTTPTRSNIRGHKKITENAIERRHKERMERQDRFLSVLETIAANMTRME